MYILHYLSVSIKKFKSGGKNLNYCLLLVFIIKAPINEQSMTIIPGAGRFDVTTSTGSYESSGSSGPCVFVGGCSTVIRVKSVESWLPSAPSDATVTSTRQFRCG